MGEAITAMFGDGLLTDLPQIQRLVLASLLSASNMPEFEYGVPVSAIIERMRQVSGVDLPDDIDILKEIRKLETSGFIRIEDTNKRLFQRSIITVEKNSLIDMIKQTNNQEAFADLVL